MARIWKRGEPGVDLLAEERIRPLRWWWPLDWWPGRFLKGRLGLVVLLAFLGVGIVWAFFWSEEGVGGGGGERVAMPAGGPVGRALSPLETGRAEVFGEPLYMGANGLPVVEHGGTGVVRELTPVEWGYDAGVAYVGQGHGRGVWAPGPRGWGIWWRLDDDVDSMRTEKKFGRDRWGEKQERELRWVASRVTAGLMVLPDLDLNHWRRGNGVRIKSETQEVRDRYGVLSTGRWEGIPGRWACDGVLERDLNQGVSLGCPGTGYQSVLGSVWVDMGAVVDHLDGIGNLVAEVDGMRRRDIHESEVIVNVLYEIEELQELVGVLNRRLDRLALESFRLGLSIRVNLFEEG